MLARDCHREGFPSWRKAFRERDL